ncbi:MAG: sortase [Candidatus Doudnabacteria bacterium]|nr:sortase [Candidatus Doudnabacteria bacterium]
MLQDSFISPHPTIRKINNVLFVSTLLLGAYIIVAPAVPEVSFFIKPLWTSAQEFLGFKKEVVTYNTVVSNEPQEPIPAENTLRIEQIDVDGVVYNGTSVSTLEKGIWHRPKSSTPDKGSNTVLVAHRFLYTSGPNTFYHLDKLKVDDEFTLFWDGEKYKYKVFENKVVPATAYDIEYPTKDPIVTLWTCTPLFTATNRLVVRAKLIDL